MKRAVSSTLTVIWLVGAAVAPVAAQPPEVLEERRAIEFVRAVATGEVDALVASMRENFAPEMFERRGEDEWRQFAARLVRHKGLEVAGVEIHTPHEIELATRSPEGMALRFIFEFEPEPPHRIAGFGVEAGGGHGGDAEVDLPPFEPGDGGREQIVAALEAWFEELETAGAFSGVALVAVDGEPIFTTAQGLATRRWGVPNKSSTRFDLGSINKSFTRVTVAQLLHQGRLALDDTIAEHLPDYPNAEVAAKVTVQHLLDHSSGIGDIFTDEFVRTSKALYRQPSDFFPLFADQPLLFEPGEGSSYSNGGFMVLGAIIAAVSGQPYDKYVVEHVFAPAGMDATGFFDRDVPVPDVAVGYTRGGHGPDAEHGGGEAEVRTNIFILPARGNSAGSAYATAGDLLRFDEALRSHRLTPPAYTRWVFGGPLPDEATEVGPERAGVAIGIAGGAPGVSAVMESGDRLTVIVLSNEDEPGAETIARALRRPLAEAVAAMENGGGS